MNEVTCPSCFEVVSVPAPAAEDCPGMMDYDCEVCCRPMVLMVAESGFVEARGLDD